MRSLKLCIRDALVWRQGANQLEKPAGRSCSSRMPLRFAFVPNTPNTSQFMLERCQDVQ
jgi:hypothetical protein